MSTIPAESPGCGCEPGRSLVRNLLCPYARTIWQRARMAYADGDEEAGHDLFHQYLQHVWGPQPRPGLQAGSRTDSSGVFGGDVGVAQRRSPGEDVGVATGSATALPAESSGAGNPARGGVVGTRGGVAEPLPRLSPEAALRDTAGPNPAREPQHPAKGAA